MTKQWQSRIKRKPMDLVRPLPFYEDLARRLVGEQEVLLQNRRGRLQGLELGCVEYSQDGRSIKPIGEVFGHANRACSIVQCSRGLFYIASYRVVSS